MELHGPDLHFVHPSAVRAVQVEEVPAHGPVAQVRVRVVLQHGVETGQRGMLHGDVAHGKTTQDVERAGAEVQRVDNDPVLEDFQRERSGGTDTGPRGDRVRDARRENDSVFLF